MPCLWVGKTGSCPQAPWGPLGALPSHPHPDSRPQNNQSYRELVEGSLEVVSAVAEFTVVSTGVPQASPRAALSGHGPDGQNGKGRSQALEGGGGCSWGHEGQWAQCGRPVGADPSPTPA